MFYRITMIVDRPRREVTQVIHGEDEDNAKANARKIFEVLVFKKVEPK